MSADHLTPSRVVAYYRMSTHTQTASIPEQREWAARACAREGLFLAAEHSDEGISGSEMDTRPGLTALLARIESEAENRRPLDALIVWDIDRLSRSDSLKTAVVLSRLMDAGCHRILTSEGWVDLTSSTDRVILNMRQDLGRNQFLSGLSRNVMRSMHARAQQGAFVGSTPPIGYVVGDDGHLTPGDPADVRMVQWMFGRYAAGASLAEIARDLNKQGRPSPRGKEWARSSVRVVLHNRAYVGDLIWNASHIGKHNRLQGGTITTDTSAASREAGRKRDQRKHLTRQKNATSDMVIVEGAHPAIVDRSLFQKAQSRRKKTSGGRGKGQVWALSAMLHCGCCGRVMHACPRSQKNAGGKVRFYRYYQCAGRRDRGTDACPLSGTVTHEWAQAETVRVLMEHLGSDEAREMTRERVEARLEQEREDCDGKAQELRKQMDELGRKIAQGNANLALLPPDRLPGVVEVIRGWERERGELAARLASVEEAAVGSAGSGEAVRRSLELLGRLDKAIDKAKPGQAREMLLSLVRKITVHFREATPEDRGKNTGNLRTVPTKLTLELTPELVNLLTPACRSKQIAPSLTIEVVIRPRIRP